MRSTRSIAITIAIALTLLSTGPASAEEAASRTWSDASGRHQFEGTFVELDEGRVHILGSDGRKVVLPITRLSPDDQAWVRSKAGVPARGGVAALPEGADDFSGLHLYATWDVAEAEAKRSNRPIFFLMAATQCNGVPGVF